MNTLSELALKFVNNTNQNIFLTGKAGTGKTTFLKSLKHSTYKSYIVVAPTGIAALNAGGVTIHSQFLLPLGTHIPIYASLGNVSDNYSAYTQKTLTEKHALNSDRKKLLQNLDLLVIDEVSMLRADVLDAIDFRLRKARRMELPFGGVQVLFIGDLFQLAPVVKQQDQHLMNQYYASPYFFHAKAFEKSSLVYVELDKIYRQNEGQFVDVLNKIRENKASQSDLDVLNKHVVTPKEIDSSAVLLTTHNKQATEINVSKLNELDATKKSFRATITGDFPESMFPVEENIELKEGARIMFVKNDSKEKRYYNGKMATVLEIEDDAVFVKMDDDSETYELQKDTWENIKYKVNEKTKEQEEDVIGSFAQYPIKLAWAITIHKSQGLTFDKATLDLGRSFTAGQVYVALSRLRSIEGLSLLNKLSLHHLFSNNTVSGFTHHSKIQCNLPEQLKSAQHQFALILVQKSFDFTAVQFGVGLCKSSGRDIAKMADKELANFMKVFQIAFDDYTKHGKGFVAQVFSKYPDISQINELLTRLNDAVNYFLPKFWKHSQSLLDHIGEIQSYPKTKAYVKHAQELDIALYKSIEMLDRICFFVKQLSLGKSVSLDHKLEESRQTKRDKLVKKSKAYDKVKVTKTKTKLKKGDKRSTYDITLELLKAGKDIKTVAKERDLAVSTIEGHLVKLVAKQELDINNYIDTKDLNKIKAELEKGISITEVYNNLKGNFTYDKLRMVKAFINA